MGAPSLGATPLFLGAIPLIPKDTDGFVRAREEWSLGINNKLQTVAASATNAQMTFPLRLRRGDEHPLTVSFGKSLIPYSGDVYFTH